jgi:uncharacterized protein (TIGR00725 family)
MAGRPPPNRRLIGVVGKGRNCPAEVYDLALQVGRMVGRHAAACILVTGGLGGAMTAAACGAREAGGLSIGLLPALSDRTTGENPCLDIPINTGVTAHIRNVILASAVDVLIAVPGSHGTLQEMILALDMEKPVWAVGEHVVQLPEVLYLDSIPSLQRHMTDFFGGDRMSSHGECEALAKEV